MTPSPPTAPSLGIDIGGSKTQAVLLDEQGRIVADHVRPTQPGADGVLATALAAARECVQRAGLRFSDLEGVGVGIPGRVDHHAGVVHTAVNLGIGRLPLGERLGGLIGVEVRVDNDVKATALGVARQLDAHDADLSYLNFGTGVAAATLTGGRLVRGSDNLAGEIGHIPVRPGAGRCACGQDGCIEVVAGGAQLTQRLSRLTPAVSLGTLMGAAADGHREAAAVAELAASGIADAVQLMVLTQGSDWVVVGGGVIQTAPGLADLARQLLVERASASAFLASLDLPGRLVVAPSGQPLAAVGAALLPKC
ncbi:ROK family protein [Micropruina sp.]|uniref:ROK family protein n=1 Tax=Micropruina sp. TaxID=2737536 RepID=UPI0039E306FC